MLLEVMGLGLVWASKRSNSLGDLLQRQDSGLSEVREYGQTNGEL